VTLLQRFIMLLSCALLWLTGCAENKLYRVGVQDGTSQAVMSEVITAPLRLAGARVIKVPCGDLRTCVQALAADKIDLLPAYSGDAAAVIRGRKIPGEQGQLEGARQAFSVLNILVTRSLGFEGPYRVVMRQSRAETAGVKAIVDLAKMPSGVSFAVPDGFASRSRDGLPALVRRHGITLARAGVESLPDVAERLAKVIDSEADVAVIRDFGYNLAESGLVRLSDSLEFFPRYQAIVLVGPAIASDFSSVQAALAPIMGRIGTADMRAIAEEVTLQGWLPEESVRRLLIAKGLRKAGTRQIQQPPIVVAVDPRDELGQLRELGSRVIAQAFPERPVEIRTTQDPFAELAAGVAQLALADASRFFELNEAGEIELLDRRAEAAAVLAERFLYLLVRKGNAGGEVNPLMRRVGIPPIGGSGARLASVFLAALDKVPALSGERAQLLEALQAGTIDAAIVVAGEHATDIATALKSGNLQLEPLMQWVGHVPLFLEEARIAAGTFPGQQDVVDTFAMQLLVAGPAPTTDYFLGAGGPASALSLRGQPLTLHDAFSLMRASEVEERPDPILQSIWERTHDIEEDAWTDIADTAMNIAVLVFVGWCLFLVISPSGVKPAEVRDRSTSTDRK
jgi:glycine betaine/choline ABC-type transport system substrate-binding protein